MNLFKRKPKNRRQDRQEVLRVKLGLRDQRRRQSRAAILFATVSLAAALIVYGLYRGGEYSLDRFVYHNKAYALLELDVDTDGVLSLEQLRRWAGVKLQDNLFTLDLARIKRDIELCSAVQSAAVERILPHTLRIRVCERIPVAQLLAPSLRSDQGQQPGCYQLDAAGWVILPLAPSQRAQPAAADEALPLITGMPATPVRPGRQIESAPVRAALELITTFEHSPMAGKVDLQQIDLSSPGTLRVVTAQNSQVVFLSRDLERQFRRWRLVHDAGLPQAKYIATLDLSVWDNAPLRWADSAAAPPVAPRTHRPSPYRRRHV